MYRMRKISILLIIFFTSACAASGQPASPTPPPDPAATQPAPASDSESETTNTTEPPTLCLSLPRPAALLHMADRSLLAYPPDDGSPCLVAPEPPAISVLAVTDDGLYYLAQKGDAALNQFQPVFLSNDLAATPLPLDNFTSVFYFAARADTSQIAWSQVRDGVQAGELISEMFVADGNGRNPRIVHTHTSANLDTGTPEALEPVAFVGSQLLFAIQPLGKGGSWNSYTGERSNLYQLSLSDNTITPLAACPAGDFTECINQVDAAGTVAITHTAEHTVSLMTLDGTTQTTVPAPAVGYVGRPVVNDRGDLAFIAADLAEDGITINTGYLQVAPGGAADGVTTVKSAPIVMLWGWVGSDALLVTTSRTQTMDQPFFMLVTLDGSERFLPETAVSLAAILP